MTIERERAVNVPSTSVDIQKKSIYQINIAIIMLLRYNLYQKK